MESDLSSLEVDPSTTLFEFLRSQTSFKSVKLGCSEGCTYDSLSLDVSLVKPICGMRNIWWDGDEIQRGTYDGLSLDVFLVKPICAMLNIRVAGEGTFVTENIFQFLHYKFPFVTKLTELKLSGFTPVLSSLRHQVDHFAPTVHQYVQSVEILAGKRVELVYQLFKTNAIPGEEDVKLVVEMAEEAVLAQEKDPCTAFANRVKEINYGNSYFFGVGNLLSDVDLQSSFLMLTKVAFICSGWNTSPEAIFHYNRDDLKGLPFKFPPAIILYVLSESGGSDR
ncbi:hypothetical protein V6N12_022909 [Hibiscus sabdariffa]|uniref:Uncharacterized protein n=1 Tax=Hibiscus sabdariffa TaxID=183260 RepID=A0ABR2FW40_9ROSI